MKLHGKNIIPSYGAGKARRIPAGTGNQTLIRGIHIVTVHKIEATFVGNPLPHRMESGLVNLIPTHMRDFELFTLIAPTAGGRKADDLAGKHAQPRSIPFLTALEQHLQTDAKSQKRLATRRLEQRGAQSAR